MAHGDSGAGRATALAYREKEGEEWAGAECGVTGP